MSDESALTSPHCVLTIAAHPPRAGERVLDVGCGSFASAFDLARLVGAKGMVVGIDGCASSPAAAVREARAAAPANATVARGNVVSYRFEHAFDRVFARLMTSCFSDPRPALSSIRTALRPGGWLVLITHAGGTSPCGPSPFASADPEVVRSMVAGAGYRDVAIDATVAPRGATVAARAWCLTARTAA